ncbi:MAG: coenzyme F420-0:L-glutamate ligase, partial [Bdellovibrionota bacterium]|nr:coenzyme F420-0:L-glutamate ligase [Bdellovibrionota bacterium]
MLSSKPIKTQIFEKNMDLHSFIEKSLKDENLEGKILAVTSKVVSLAEGRLVTKNSISKDDLVVKESDHYLGKIAYDCHLTIKEGLLIASAGIDESNSQEDHYILFPEDPFQSAKAIYEKLKLTRGLKEFGVILTDSHTTALRRGVVGAALAYYGFSGVKNKIGSKDLFGRELQMTSMNLADSIATAAT